VTPEQLARVVRDALADAVAAGELTLPNGVPEHVTIERPRLKDHGDYATNVAMQLAKQARRNPRELAQILASRMQHAQGIDRVDIAGPGFLNLTIASGAQGALARQIVEAAHSYGRSDTQHGARLNLEFVSANPTGPIHIGGVRWAAVGDALARVLEACSANVAREYYFNDTGAQIDRFAQSLLAVARGEPVPDDGYSGSYVEDIAKAIVAKRPDAIALPDAEAQEVFRAEGVALMFLEIQQSLHEFGVDFDVFFNEQTLHDNGELDKALAQLTEQGHTYEHDGAVWLRTTTFGDDKDRPLRKSNGDWTYFAADCAYYLDKRERGFDLIIIMLGADHHGYVGRMRAMAACFGDNPDETLEILIGQLVSVVKNGQPVRMSKRAGNVVLLLDLVEAIGVDATRYALARYSVDSPIELDLDLWAKQTEENPVYYVQYAHARTCNVTRNAAEHGMTLDPTAFRPELLIHERESDLLGTLGEFPRIVATAAELREVHRIARYLEELAGVYHRWYDSCRVLPRGDEAVTDLGLTRLWLNEATRTVLANGLGLLGVSAPERM
jgi:arginyl-tRNA synthetase